MLPKLRSFPLLAFLVLFAAVGCDDPSNPDPDPDPDPDPIGDPIADEVRMAAFGEIQAELEELLALNATPAEQNQAIAAYLETRSEFREVGVDTAASTVWAVFTDGRGVIIPNNLELGVDTFGASASRAAHPAAAPAPAVLPRARTRVSTGSASVPSQASAVAWDATEMPTATRARLMQSFDAGRPFGDGAAQTLGILRRVLEAAGWTVVTGGASIAELRAINGGDGYFYINTHGGSGATWDDVRLPVYALQTSTKVTLFGEVDSLTKADLDAGRLVYMWGDYDGDAGNIIPRVDLRYAITPKFVQRYMSFALGAVVILNACSSGSTNAVANDMVQAFRAQGASVVLGWTDAVNGWDAWNGALYLTDRLAGANLYEPEASPHRPFPLEPVLDHMSDEGIDRSKNSLLRAVGPLSGAGFGLLRPTIERLQVDSLLVGTLLIHGAFGSDPGAANRGVIVRDGGDILLPVVSWTADSIRVVPVASPQTQGFSGDIVVRVRGLASNPRRLHAWHGTATYVMAELGTLQLRIDMDFAARFDPDSTRAAPGDPAEANRHPQVFGLIPQPDTEARWTASGTWTEYDCTETWTGSGTILAAQPTQDRAYVMNARLHPATREFLLEALLVTDRDGYTIVHACTDLTETSEMPVSFEAVSTFEDGTSDWLTLQVDEQWRLVREELSLPPEHAMVWPHADAIPVYDPAQPK